MKQIAYVKCDGGGNLDDRHSKTNYFLDTIGDKICPVCGEIGEVAWWVKK